MLSSILGNSNDKLFIALSSCMLEFNSGFTTTSSIFISITLPDNAQISEELVYNPKMGKEKERNFEIKLNSKDKNNIEKSMKNSKNWIKGYLLKSDLYIFIDDFDYNDSSYYLIYNSDNKEYNSVPESTGVYKYYVASYNPNSTDGNIEISEFYYQYKK